MAKASDIFPSGRGTLSSCSSSTPEVDGTGPAVLMHSISGPMRCISLCTLGPGVKLQLPHLQFIRPHVWRFQKKAALLQFGLNPVWFKSSRVSHFWACRFSIHILVSPGALVKYHQLPPTCVPNLKSASCQVRSKYSQMCACSARSIKYASDVTCVGSGQLSTPQGLGTFVCDGQKYVLSKCSKYVLRKFTRAHLHNV